MKGDEIWQAKLGLAIADFQARLDSDDVFKARLYGLGFRGVRLEEEFRFQLGLRHDTEKHQTLDGRLSLSRASSSASSDSS